MFSFPLFSTSAVDACGDVMLLTIASRPIFPGCHCCVGLSFAEVPAGYLLWCRCTAELHIVLNDEYTHQWQWTCYATSRQMLFVKRAFIQRTVCRKRYLACWFANPYCQSTCLSAGLSFYHSEHWTLNLLKHTGSKMLNRWIKCIEISKKKSQQWMNKWLSQ